LISFFFSKKVKSFFCLKKKGKETDRKAFRGISLSLSLSLSLLAAVAGEGELVRGGREVVLDRGVSDLFSFFFVGKNPTSEFFFSVSRNLRPAKNLKKKQTLTPCGP